MEVRRRLLNENKLGGFYVPEMEVVHRRNAARLREIIAEHGWPHEEIAGEDGAKAAWLIAQHAPLSRRPHRLLLPRLHFPDFRPRSA